jgi:PAS domain S-box-containing protein
MVVILLVNKFYRDLLRSYQYTNSKGHDRIPPIAPGICNTCHGRFKLLDAPCDDCSALPVFETGEIVERVMINPADGRVREVRAFPIKNSGGEVVSVVEYVRDITERKQAQDALAAEKERLLVTLHSIGDGVIATDAGGNIVLMNKIAEDLTMWKQNEAEGRPFTDVVRIVNEITRAACDNPVDKVLSSGSIIELANHTLLISREGKERVISDSGAPIRNNAGAIIGVVLVFRDMTEKQKLMEAVLNTQKLEALGVLAGGIAHDFNNLLTGILGFIDLIRMETREPLVADYCTSALSAMNRARSLTQQLLTFAKGGAPVKRPGALFPFVQETVHFALSGSSISCDFKINADL